MPKPPDRRSSTTEIDAFLRRSRAVSQFSQTGPRLLFAVDATASRQPTWQQAMTRQQAMFRATRDIAALAVQLCYYRGFHEFHAGPWTTDSDALAKQMAGVHCEGGLTQIARVLRHALAEHGTTPLRAAVLIGDAMEENPDTLCDLAGQCGLRRLPLFVFQEGGDPVVERTFGRLARLSGGAWARFDLRSAATLSELLSAVASYAAGGRAALQKQPGKSAKLLLDQIKD